MKVFGVILLGIIIIWPIICWVSYHIAGWAKWEKRFKRDVTRDMMLATAVGLKKFGTYNGCVFVGVEDYGVSFKPMKILLFHHPFSLPWVQILSYQAQIGRLSSVCILHTTLGDIRVYGEVAQIVAGACASHYVTNNG